MQVLTTLADEANTFNMKQEFEKLCKDFSNASGLDGVILHPESGMIIVQGWNKHGGKAQTAIGFDVLRMYPTQKIVAYTIQRIRMKLGEPQPKKRRYVGTLRIPLE